MRERGISPDESRGEIFILAGGLSSRMGRDKSGVKIAGETLLGRVRRAAVTTGWPVRVVRRDAVARCGPLGGIFTAFKRSRAEVILFLACDMPLVSPELLREMARRFESPARPFAGLFAKEDGRAGFPFILRRSLAEGVVAEHIERGEFSLQALARKLGGKFMRGGKARELMNLNTPADCEAAEVLLRRREKGLR